MFNSYNNLSQVLQIISRRIVLKKYLDTLLFVKRKIQMSI